MCVCTKNTNEKSLSHHRLRIITLDVLTTVSYNVWICLESELVSEQNNSFDLFFSNEKNKKEEINSDSLNFGGKQALRNRAESRKKIKMRQLFKNAIPLRPKARNGEWIKWIYEFTLPTDFNRSWLFLSSPLIIPKLLPTTPPMPNPSFKSFCTTEWCRCAPEFWFTMCECEWPWFCWWISLLLCWADFSFFNFSCSSRSRRAYTRNEKRKKTVDEKFRIQISTPSAPWLWFHRRKAVNKPVHTCSLISLTARSSFFNFIRRFWNQILICRSVRQSAWAISIRRLRVK